MSPGFDASRRVVDHPIPYTLHALSQGSVAVALTVVSAIYCGFGGLFFSTTTAPSAVSAPN